MKSFEIDNKEYRMPESLREISLGDFIKLQHIMQEDIAEPLKNCKVISLLTKVELDLLTNAGQPDLAQAAHGVKMIFSDWCKFKMDENPTEE
jgi:hypothetical protein